MSIELLKECLNRKVSEHGSYAITFDEQDHAKVEEGVLRMMTPLEDGLSLAEAGNYEFQAYIERMRDDWNLIESHTLPPTTEVTENHFKNERRPIACHLF